MSLANPEQHLDAALELNQAGKHDQALTLYQDIILKTPWFIPAYPFAANTATALHLYRYAINLADMGIQKLTSISSLPPAPKPDSLASNQEHTKPTGPTKPQIDQQHSLLLNSKAAALSELGRNREATQLLQESYNIYPKPSTLVELGSLLVFDGRFDEAEKQFQFGILQADSISLSITFHNNLAKLLEHKGQFADALTYFQKATAIAPEDPGARLQLAKALTQRGNYDEALAELQTIEPVNKPEYLTARELSNTIKSLAKSWQKQTATIARLKAESRKSPDPRPYLKLGLRYLKARQEINAITTWQDALLDAPGDLECSVNLAATLADNLFFHAALPFIQEALRAHPDEPRVWSLYCLSLAGIDHSSRRIEIDEAYTRTLRLLNTLPGLKQETALSALHTLTIACCRMKDWVRALQTAATGFAAVCTLTPDQKLYKPVTPDIDKLYLEVADQLMEGHQATQPTFILAGLLAYKLTQFLPLSLYFTGKSYDTGEQVISLLLDSFPEAQESYPCARAQYYKEFELWTKTSTSHKHQSANKPAPQEIRQNEAHELTRRTPPETRPSIDGIEFDTKAPHKTLPRLTRFIQTLEAEGLEYHLVKSATQHCYHPSRLLVENLNVLLLATRCRADKYITLIPSKKTNVDIFAYDLPDGRWLLMSLANRNSKETRFALYPSPSAEQIKSPSYRHDYLAMIDDWTLFRKKSATQP